MGAALADADKASHYCRAAGERALRLLAFEEAAVHFARSLEVAEQFGPPGPGGALRRAHRSGGGAEPGRATPRRPTPTSRRAAALARAMGDAGASGRGRAAAGPLSYLGIVRAERGTGAAARGGPWRALPGARTRICGPW